VSRQNVHPTPAACESTCKSGVGWPGADWQGWWGNGRCNRPTQIDCNFETICESCSFFTTGIEFRPTLQNQRDNAASKGQTTRQRVFDNILKQLDETGT
jgi:hypothetical protein